MWIAAKRNLSPADFKIISGRIYNRRKKRAGRPENNCADSAQLNTKDEVADELGVSPRAIARIYNRRKKQAAGRADRKFGGVNLAPPKTKDEVAAELGVSPRAIARNGNRAESVLDKGSTEGPGVIKWPNWPH